MKPISPKRADAGFTLLELMVAAGIFLVLSGAAFSLLALSQKSYQNQSQVLNSFQEARLGIDQMVRDINISGYPPASEFAVLPSNPSVYAISSVAWSPNYPAPCSIGVDCTTPGNFDLILETDPLGTGQVQWIRYQLQSNTLYRGMVPKNGGDPNNATQGAMAPFVQNVYNNATGTQIAQFQAIYPQMYPGVKPLPIFTFMCTRSDNNTQPCSVLDNPSNISDIEITLIVMSPTPDAQTGQQRLLELNGRAHRTNPN